MPAAIPERLRPLNEPSPSADPSTSHAKILRGLRDQSNAPLFPNQKRGEALPTEADLEGLLKSAREITLSVRATTDSWKEKLATRRDGEIAKMESMLSGLLNEGDNFPGGRSAANRHIDETRQRILKKIESDLAPVRDLIAETDKATVDDRLTRLNAAKEKLTRWKAAYPSPLAMLETFGLSNPLRATYMANIASAGPGALKTLMQEAMAKNDILLAAAVATRVGQLDPKERPFSAHQVAQTMVGDVHAKFTEAARVIDMHVDGAGYELRGYFAGEESDDAKLAKIRRGLSDAQAAAAPEPPPAPKPAPGVDPETARLDTIAPGLKGTGKLIERGIYRADMTPGEVAAAVAALEAAEKQEQ